MRKISFFNVLFSFFLIVAVSLGNVSIAFADDSSPGDSAAAESTEGAGDPPVIEAPAEEAPPDLVVEEQQPDTGEAVSSDEVVETTESTDEEGLLTQLPPNTELVVLDENGDAVPLATQDALDVILDTDPMWCPANTLPGGANCSINYATIKDLLKDMVKYTENFDENGVIYFTATAGSTFDLTDNNASLGAADFGTLKTFNLILQGGWNGLNGANADFSGQTNFATNALTIGTETNPWVGSLTLNNFLFSGVTSANSVTIYTTTGSITLNNVDIAQQAGAFYTANLDSVSGNILVTNGSSFDGNNTGTRQSQGFRAETGGFITITGTSGTPITFTDSRGTSTDYNGATLSAPTVSLNYVTASNNDLNGIQISNASLVTLNNVIASSNGTETALPDPQDPGSGVLVNGTGSTLVNLFGGTFTNNERYGVEVINGRIIILSTPTCTGNDLGCLYDTNPPTLSLPGNMTVEATSAAGATVMYSATSTDNIDGNVAAYCSPVSGSVFPLGATTVNCSSTDSHNQTATGSFSITVHDTTSPTLTLPPNITAEATSAAGVAVTYSASATDIVDGNVTVNCLPTSGSVFQLGTTTVNCSATDAHSNTATGTFTVTVRDTTPPTLSLPANITTEATSATGAAVSYSASATDIVDGNLAVNCSPASGSMFALGTTTVNCSVTDAHGNTATGSFTVSIGDTAGPTIQMPGNIEERTHSPFGAIVSYVSPSTFDLVDGTGVATCTPSSGSFFDKGYTLVTCTATDSHGNSATPVTFLVRVKYIAKEIPAASPSSQDSSLVPVTAGELIDLNCNTAVNAFGIIVNFHNLCGYQAIITQVDPNTLPGELEGGSHFENGVNIALLLNGEVVNELPAGAGVEVNFPISAAQDEFAALLWDGSNGSWMNAGQTITATDLSNTLLLDGANEFYHVQSTGSTNTYYQILTTEFSGTFVIASK